MCMRVIWGYMLSSVTLNCQVTLIVRNPSSQLCCVFKKVFIIPYVGHSSGENMFVLYFPVFCIVLMQNFKVSCELVQTKIEFEKKTSKQIKWRQN